MAKSMTHVGLNLSIVFLITSVVLTFDTLIVFCSGNKSHHVLCVESERQALVRFKQDLTFHSSNRLSSWAGGGDCCEWVGVVCNNLTGNVHELHLQNPFLDALFYGEYEAFERSLLGGKLNPSLLDLKHLSYLDLSGNDFHGTEIPSFIGSLGSLRYLNLSDAGFGGLIPTQLGNLSALHSLDLGGAFEGVIPHQLGNLSNLHYLRLESWSYPSDGLYAETLEWLSGNSLLQHLHLEGMNLSKASDWLQVTNMLPSLLELRLSFCQLHHFPPLHHPLNFTSLSFLDLSYNQFESLIPDWLLGLSGLHHLNLEYSDLHGSLPSGMRNITSLRYLDLSGNSFNSTIPEWISNFSHLEYLDLSFSGLTAGRFPRSFENLCNLKQLRLFSVELGGDISEVSDILSRCILDKLETLDLSGNKLSGHFPELGESKKLVALDLSSNSLSGQVPASLGRLSSLKILDFSNNNLSGPLPQSLGQLAHLQEFSMSQNSLQGVMSEAHFANFTRLTYLFADGNQLFLSVAPNWVPQFQLHELSLKSWLLGPQFPPWLHSQKNLVLLDISHTEISGIIPRWFWNLSSQMLYLNLSHNHIHGEIGDELLAASLPWTIIDLSSNHFNGTLPRLSSNVSTLDLSDNSFSGSISHFLCYKLDESKSLEFLNLEKNLLSGELPNCWTSWIGLEVLHLGNNNLSGKIPNSMGSLNFLKSLNLRNNSLSGELPPSLQNCTSLVAVDFGENEFSGSIPTWIGERLQNLKILILRSNKFRSHIPKKLCALKSLQILDLAHNNISGIIPACFMNLSAMAIKQKSTRQISYLPTRTAVYSQGFLENVILVIKGQMAGYSTILQLVTSIDFSDNNLSGEIPEELTSLQGLYSLNLSYNLLTGRIPKDIGAMEQLEALDFAMNHLSGEIPWSMSSLTFLSHLNLSYNNLSGKIPSSTQLQSFSAFSFFGNNLCGPPINNNCNVNDTPSTNENGDGKRGDGFEEYWFYTSMALGFVVGFWGVAGPFLFNKSWRFACFQFMDNIWYRFHGVIC